MRCPAAAASPRGGADPLSGRLILDLSRTLARALHSVPTGIDRVEMAYAEGLLLRADARLDFAAMHPLGRFATLPAGAARRFVALVARRWRDGAADDTALRKAARGLRTHILLHGDPPFAPPRRAGHAPRAAYLLVSHHHLDRPAMIRGALRRRDAAFVCMVHDLIPLEYAEYARPAEPARHRRRIETVAGLADAILCNSEATRRSLQPWLDRAGRAPPCLVAPLGVAPPGAGHAATPPPGAGRPYFVFLGTIEPRKNHLLALHVWRRLAELHGDAAPGLALIGRRGWENEQVVDMIERCAPLRGLLDEYGDLSDTATQALLRGARALVLPSFAEGYGLPVAEALALGVPVLCSDLPALREVGGDVPEYLDPLDGPGWLRAVTDYAAPAAPRRAAQLARLASWRPPSWDAHLDRALAFVAEID